MTANLLTLNSSKTEFLLIGLKQQLSKIHDSSLITTHSARNRGLIFDNTLPSQTKPLHFLNPATVTITFMNFAVSAHLDFKTASIIAISMSIQNLITVTLSLS